MLITEWSFLGPSELQFKEEDVMHKGIEELGIQTDNLEDHEGDRL